MPEDIFTNPVWHALETRQRRFAQFAGDACKYVADVAPFAAVATRSEQASRQLCSLLAPGEVVYMMGAAPFEVPGLVVRGTLPGLQMIFPDDAELPATGHADLEILPLSCAHAEEMVALTEIAFPGYFRIRTCEMGTYYGVRINGALVAMAGERFAFDRYVEISGVCTHPEHRGHGYAAALITRLLLDHRRDGWLSCLHTGAANKNAIRLYERIGFAVNRDVNFHRVLRSE
ncbi:MAG TPA: GNAT family N-acetyltransferase [Terracidiphilus sp.]|nr:GNAT family N-acetyltransferase [Terracidiphilus sp.]